MKDENLIKIGQRAIEWAQLTNAGLLLRLGEMTAQEIRTVRAGGCGWCDNKGFREWKSYELI